jgi:hypothetical protein
MKAEFTDQFKAMLNGQTGMVTVVFEQVTPIMEHNENQVDITGYLPTEVASVIMEQRIVRTLAEYLAKLADTYDQKEMS